MHYCMNCGERVGVQRYDVKEKKPGQVEILDPVERRKAERKKTEEKKGEAGGVMGELPAGESRGVAELGGKPRADAEMAGGEAGKELPGRGWAGGRS